MSIPNNMGVWDLIRTPPSTALKLIGAGRLKGKSDINPQWRFEAMTQVFGPVGDGWKYTIDNLWLEPVADGQIVAFAQVSISFKMGDTWSEPIPGIGGNKLVEQESSGLHVNDECYKMAVTDALGVAMKALGMAADVYAGQIDGSKYSRPEREPAYRETELPNQDESPDADLVVTWGKEDSPWRGMKLSEVWDAGPKGHEYLHWIAERSNMSATRKAAARAVINRNKNKVVMASADEIVAFRSLYESFGLDLDILGETIRTVEEKNGGVPADWLKHQSERLMERFAEPEDDSGGYPTTLLDEDELGFN